uniref:Uncharacterized protein n=1 Tax=Oryza rufipogon TaxID=4529 RepID=A0A0E0P4P9_ORYRU
MRREGATLGRRSSPTENPAATTCATSHANMPSTPLQGTREFEASTQPLRAPLAARDTTGIPAHSLGERPAGEIATAHEAGISRPNPRGNPRERNPTSRGQEIFLSRSAALSLAQKRRPRAGAAVPPPPARRATTGLFLRREGHRSAAVTRRRAGSTGSQHRRRTGGRSKATPRTGGGGIEAQIQGSKEFVT